VVHVTSVEDQRYVGTRQVGAEVFLEVIAVGYIFQCRTKFIRRVETRQPQGFVFVPVEKDQRRREIHFLPDCKAAFSPLRAIERGDFALSVNVDADDVEVLLCVGEYIEHAEVTFQQLLAVGAVLLSKVDHQALLAVAKRILKIFGQIEESQFEPGWVAEGFGERGVFKGVESIVVNLVRCVRGCAYNA